MAGSFKVGDLVRIRSGLSAGVQGRIMQVSSTFADVALHAKAVHSYVLDDLELVPAPESKFEAGDAVRVVGSKNVDEGQRGNVLQTFQGSSLIAFSNRHVTYNNELLVKLEELSSEEQFYKNVAQDAWSEHRDFWQVAKAVREAEYVDPVDAMADYLRNEPHRTLNVRGQLRWTQIAARAIALGAKLPTSV